MHSDDRAIGLSRRAVLGVALGLPAALAGGLTAAPAAAQGAAGTIAGRVFDRVTGADLPGAIVTVGYETQQRATVTDGAGRYALDGIAPGRLLDVIAFLPGYTYLLLNRDLPPGGAIIVDFGIIPEPNPGPDPDDRGAAHQRHQRRAGPGGQLQHARPAGQRGSALA